MKHYSFIQAPYLSFFSKRLYQSVCHTWKGVGFTYLLFLLGICWLPTVLQIHSGFSRFVETDAPPIIEQIPVINITNGEAVIEEEQPFYINDPDSGETIAIIDTTGSITSLSDVEAEVLLTKTKIIYKKNDIETRTYNLDQIQDFRLDQDRINGWMAIMKNTLAIAIYPFALSGSFIIRVIQVLIYALLGMAFSSITKSRRSYLELIRLSVVALSPPLIIKTLLSIFDIDFPFMSSILFCVTMGYLYWGVKAASEKPTD